MSCAECDLFKSAFLAAMEWFCCNADSVEESMRKLRHDRRMIGEERYAEELRQLKAMWNALYAKDLGTANNAVRGAAEPRTLDGLVGA